MKTLSRLLTVSLFAAVPLLANVTYTYSGPLFTTVNGSYTTAMTITGYITFASALPDGASPGYYETPTDWSFFDGLQTLSKSGGDILTNYQFGTDAMGNINDWVVTADTPDLTTGHIQEVSNNEGGTQEYADLGSSFAFVESQGSWITSTAAVPEPSTFAMLLLPLAWLGARKIRTVSQRKGLAS